MSKIVITISGCGDLEPEALRALEEDCEDILRFEYGAQGVSDEIEVLP